MPVGYTPIYKIMKDDLDITDRFNDRLIEIKLTMTSGGGDTDTVNLTLDNRDYKLATPDVGAKLQIYLGYKEIGYAYEGVYEINTYEYAGPPHSLKITGTSTGYMGALKAPAFQAHEARTINDIIGEIAGKGGAEPYVHSQFSGIKIPYFNQTMSPLHMLHELERRYGAVGKFQDGKLLFIPRGEGQTYSGASQPVLILDPWMFASPGGYSVRFSTRTAYAKVKVPWKDQNGHIKWAEQDNPNRAAMDGTGAQDAQGSNETYLYPKQQNSEAEAKKFAESVMDMLRRQEVEANFVLAKGDPWIRDQCPVLVRNMFDPINGPYIADTVTHTYTKTTGIQTTILARYPNTNANFAPVDPNTPLGLSGLNPGLFIPTPDGSGLIL